MNSQSNREKQNLSIQKIIGIGIVLFFSVTLFVSFVIFPDIGEKILYGKHPPGKDSTNLEYGQIIVSVNYECLESASNKAQGKLPDFVEFFNKCNNS